MVRYDELTRAPPAGGGKSALPSEAGSIGFLQVTCSGGLVIGSAFCCGGSTAVPGSR